MASQTETAWEALFERLKLLTYLNRDGIATITADQIKTLGKREPRLMTKFDTRESRPDILKQADCTVLPISNGTYVVVRGDGYADLSPANVGERPTRVTDKALDHLQTLQRFCKSEAEVLEVAHTCGLLTRFLGEPVQRTSSGRARASFHFRFSGEREHALVVDGVQVEVDACFEGERVYVFEAKIGARDNFHLRQLYYPVRMWRATGVTKPIVPIFVTYSDSVFTFYEYTFDDSHEYNSARLVRRASYLLDDGAEPRSLRALLAVTEPEGENALTPFPQADDVRKVVDVVDAVAIGIASKEELTTLYDFAPRQASYYGDAGRYLGFLELRRGAYALTDAGRAFSALPAGERVDAVARALLRSPVFRGVAARFAATANPTDRDAVAQLIARHRPELTGTTPRRRAQTVARWMDWLDAHLTSTR